MSMKLTHIIIHDLSGKENTSYVAHKREDCRDAVDRSAYDACRDHQEVITMGLVIAEPVFG
jgi:hypothetical protein